MATSVTSLGVSLSAGAGPIFFVPKLDDPHLMDTRTLKIYKIERGEKFNPAKTVTDERLCEIAAEGIHVEKNNQWLGVDPRPHTHPWTFYSEVKTGWIKERRWRLVDDLWVHEDLVHKAGEIYLVPRGEIHDVVDGDWGNTLTHMICGEAVDNDTWAQMDMSTSKMVPKNQLDPKVAAWNMEAFAATNVHFFGALLGKPIRWDLYEASRERNLGLEWPEFDDSVVSWV